MDVYALSNLFLKFAKTRYQKELEEESIQPDDLPADLLNRSPLKEKLLQYSKQPLTFAHFSDIQGRFSFNPQFKFNNPFGIYGYLLDDNTIEALTKKSMFAAKRPFIHIFTVKPNANLLNLSSFTKSDLYAAIQNLNHKTPGLVNKYIDDAIRSSRDTRPGTVFWNLTKLIADNAKNWTRLLLTLGYDGVIDYGSGTLHPNEPKAVVVFPGAESFIETLNNSIDVEKVKKALRDCDNVASKLQEITKEDSPQDEDLENFKTIFAKLITTTMGAGLFSSLQNEKIVNLKNKLDNIVSMTKNLSKSNNENTIKLAFTLNAIIYSNINFDSNKTKDQVRHTIAKLIIEKDSVLSSENKVAYTLVHLLPNIVEEYPIILKTQTFKKLVSLALHDGETYLNCLIPKYQKEILDIMLSVVTGYDATKVGRFIKALKIDPDVVHNSLVEKIQQTTNQKVLIAILQALFLELGKNKQYAKIVINAIQDSKEIDILDIFNPNYDGFNSFLSVIDNLSKQQQDRLVGFMTSEDQAIFDFYINAIENNPYLKSTVLNRIITPPN